MSRRFVAGESLDDFVRAAEQARAGGVQVTGNYLGEAVTDSHRAELAAEAYVRMLERLRAEELAVNVSVKPSQLGMDISPQVLLANVETLLAASRETSAFVRFDMESSAYTDRTLDLFRALWARGNRGIGIVLQASLRRTARDLEALIGLGASVRLCKGAYVESPGIAYQTASEVGESFRRLMHRLLGAGHDPAIATHDEVLIRDTVEHARQRGIASSSFELQLLYGVRRDLQRALVDRGYRVRVYIPFGGNWYPYLMRRLAERPGNVLFLVGSVLKESPLGAMLPGRRGLERNGR
jgi:proline dehydrogenase